MAWHLVRELMVNAPVCTNYTDEVNPTDRRSHWERIAGGGDMGVGNSDYDDYFAFKAWRKVVLSGANYNPNAVKSSSNVENNNPGELLSNLTIAVPGLLTNVLSILSSEWEWVREPSTSPGNLLHYSNILTYKMWSDELSYTPRFTAGKLAEELEGILGVLKPERMTSFDVLVGKIVGDERGEGKGREKGVVAVDTILR